jgi:uncharacterized protein with HEPN domain
MYNYKNILYLVSAIAASQKVIHYSHNFTTAIEFLESSEQVYFNATITLLIAIGEEVKKIDKQLLKSEPNIEWQNISDMRNVLAHDYRGIDEDILFKVVKIEIPKLKSVLIEFLKMFPKNDVQEVLETKQYKHLKGIL